LLTIILICPCNNFEIIFDSVIIVLFFLMPASCDEYREVFSLSHALDCCRGGLVTQHLNGIRDALGDLAALGYREVVCEPVGVMGMNYALIANLGIQDSELQKSYPNSQTTCQQAAAETSRLHAQVPHQQK